ncbi:von Willebrand factor D and EGF domain-containing protein-like, partial [Saccostrea cucullata]|uniref:von Willebrand factor D and EGF domain-containing protein-like n=1 Tax=Saccostrea cuccullata TaxID=36930 RepID=UPI002ED5000B
TLPENGTMARRTVCRVGFQNKCVQSHTIMVKNCGFFAVYELTPLSSCNSAYCFQPSSTCVEGVPTNLSVSYHGVSWTSHPNETATDRTHIPSVNLICNFTPINEENIFYEVNWYIDNKEAIRNQTLATDKRTKALLSASEILQIKGKAGSMIHCVVGAKFRPADSPCSSKSSPLFFAGIKLLRQRIVIEKNQKAIIPFQLTIPFADQTLVLDKDEKESVLYINSAVHNGSHVSCEDSRRYNCAINITSYKYSERWKYDTDEWKGIQNFTFYNDDDGDYTPDTHLILRLQTVGTQGGQLSPTKIFEDVLLPDVQVMIVDNKTLWKGKSCFSVTDPHIFTFDNVWYQCMLPGTFILYKNDLYNQEVQEKHFMCTHGATCNCAVAVRSGRDVFTIDMCGRQREIINFPLCDDSVLKVVKKADRLYEVLLPTGTRVKISINWRNETGWFLNAGIYPSTSDIGNTRGLCGIMDGKKENEFTGRNNFQYPTNITRRPDFFSSTWIVRSEENLLIEDQNVFSRLKSISTTMTRVCKCDNSTGQYKTVCNYGNVIDCKFTVGKRYHCLTHPETVRRRKRDLKHLQTLDLFNKHPFLENENSVNERYKRETTLTRMTFEEAKNFCLTMFEMSEAYITCRSFVADLNIDASLESCISDLQ